LRLLQVLKNLGVYTEVIYSRGSVKVSEIECLDERDFIDFLNKYSDKIYSEEMLEAPPSSSSYLADFHGFVVAPTSLNTLAKVAHGIADNLITRVAINALRIRKRIIFLLRETPLGVIELRNALNIAKAGGVILPASPGFYHDPYDILDLIDFVVGKILDLLEIRHDLYKRWQGSSISRRLCQRVF
jgi:4-hydroxy-3-polyprenylbenzoate decarboxylase